MFREIIKLAYNTRSSVFIIADELDFTGKIIDYTDEHVKILTNELVINNFIGSKQIVTLIDNISTIALLSQKGFLDHCLSLPCE